MKLDGKALKLDGKAQKFAEMHLKNFLVGALIAGSEGERLPSLVDQGKTVDSKSHEAEDETFRSVRILEAEAKKAYDAELKMFGNVRPVRDGPENSADGDGQEAAPSKTRRSRGVRSGGGPPKSGSEEPKPSDGRRANEPDDPRAGR
ncbi:MAG: hypothetical protein LBR80_13550 [Deltaproteobacteria bacterium]|nr:hypothetical protein [Deltaproteobacteria bacterium]